MTRVTRFAGRDPGSAARMAGFLAHLRENGWRLGVQETDAALTALSHVCAADHGETRLALKAICAGCREEAERFDALFDSYWMDAGRVRTKVVPKKASTTSDNVHSSRDGDGQDASGSGQLTAPDGGEGNVESDGEGKLIPSELRNLNRRDLRDLVRAEEIATAEGVARQLGEALRDRRSRRRIAARKGDRLHFRRTIRRSLAT